MLRLHEGDDDDEDDGDGGGDDKRKQIFLVVGIGVASTFLSIVCKLTVAGVPTSTTTTEYI